MPILRVISCLLCLSLVLPIPSVLAESATEKVIISDEDLKRKTQGNVNDTLKKVVDEMSKPEYWDKIHSRMENVAVKMPMVNEVPIKWSVLGDKGFVRDMRFLTRDRLLVSYQFDDIILVDTAKSEVLWRIGEEDWKKEKFEARIFDIVMALEDTILIRSDRDLVGQIMVAAIDAETGQWLWKQSFKKKKKSFDIVPVPHESAVLVIEREKKKATVRAYNMFTGTLRWERPYKISSKNGHPPKPLISTDGVWNFMSGVQKLSMADGKPEWERGYIVLDGRTPPPRRNGEKLFVVDHEGSLHTLDAVTGKTAGSVQLDQSVRYTNIYPLGDRVYLRGEIQARKSPTAYIMEVLRKSDGKKLWRYSRKEASVSNLIDDGARLFFSTPSTVICLDRTTGEKIFTSPASQTGLSFPVQIKKYGNTVVYIGEVIIAGFDARTGKRIWRHGMTPLAQDMHLDSLDSFIDRLQERIGVLTKGIWSISGGVDYDYWDRQERYRQNLDGKIWLQMDFFFAMKELGDTMRMYASKDDQSEIVKLEFIRRALYSAYLTAQGGDYVYRPHLEEGHTGLYLIHLPTGKSSFTALSPDATGYNKFVNWNSRGLWNLVDLQKGLVYHHALRISPDRFQDEKLAENERNYGVYLVGQEINIPR